MSKQINIDGPVKGKNLNFIAGDFDYDVDDKNYRKIENYFNGAGYISSSEFGSIYGEQIKILAIDGNVGIKGDIISNKDLHIKGIYESTTEGQIIVNRNLYIDIEGAYISNGDIEVEEAAYINMGKSLFKGRLSVNKELFINGYVDNSGIIIADSITNGLGIHGSEFYNTGLVYTTDSFKGNLLINYGEIINANGNLSVNDIYNSGIMNSQSINAGILKNHGIIEGENLEIKSEKLHNSGELNAKNLKLIFKDFSSQGGKITADNISFENYPE